METCLFKDKRICSLDLIDEFEHKNTVLEKEWRLAGQNGALKCEECDIEVFLKFGSIKIPHFAHKFDSSNNCFYKNYPESEERRNAKFLIYNYLKECYGSQKVQINCKCVSGIRSDFFIEISNSHKIAIELQRLDLETKDWDRKNRLYNQNKIIPIWILFGKRKKNSNYDDFRYFERLNLCDTKDNILRIIDVDTKTLTLVKDLIFKNTITNDIHYKDVFAKNYSLTSNQIPKGKIFTDYIKSFKEKETEFFECCQKRLTSEEEQKKEISKIEKYYSNPIIGKDISDNMYENRKEKFVFEEKWGVCEFCGEKTKDWWYYDGKTKKCKCKKCASLGKYS
jgi:competence CoiA-like predicted nuclease